MKIRPLNAFAGRVLIAALLAGAPALALSQASPFLTGATSLQNNILILRCSGSDSGGTARFASHLIGEREIIRRQTARNRDRDGLPIGRSSRRSHSTSEQHVLESAVMPSEIEQLPDLAGYLKTASSPAWRRVRIVR
ncbi:MAG TPA: type IV secretion system DNA-binding domain-containing protein [Steroidobacteraceae bacterium]|nr:type IV secretion system DNA-binding domain-containing protein [Steroidobacteraceae bacterium]